MRVLDLFSGIGGVSLGLERAGMSTVGFCELDPYCRAVLRKHWPQVPIHEDVRTLTALDVGAVDVIAGGFPCQDISVAGRGAGLDGDRSSLWWEFYRLICECRPRYALIENSPVLRRRGLDRILRALAEVGFDAEWHCVPASALGACHRRDRIWIVAYTPRESGGSRDVRDGRGASEADRIGQADHVVGSGGVPFDSTQARVAADADRDAGGSRRSDHAEQGAGRRDTGGSDQRKDDSADAAGLGLQERERIFARWQVADAAAAPHQWWPTESPLCRADDGVRGRVDRIRALGNSVVPQVVEALGRAIMRRERGEE